MSSSRRMKRSKTLKVRETARTTSPDHGRYSEAGDTLIEVLLALIVLGLASVALLIAFSTSISASAEHRKLATSDTVLATATQVTIANIQSQPSLFSSCAPIASYEGPTYATSGITLPSPYAGKYTVFFAASNPVKYWNGQTFTTTCTAGADEPELITIYLSGTTDTNSFVVDYPIGTSSAFASGGAAQLVFLQQPVGGYAGSPFTQQPIVEILTSGANTVTTDLSPVILTLTQGSGVLSGCTGNEILGVVTFSGCTIGTGGSNFEITATDGTLTPAVSNQFSVSSSGYHLVFTAQPVAGASGVAFTTSPVVTVENSLNLPDVSWAGTITLTLSGGALSALPGHTCAFTNATTITLTPSPLTGSVTIPSGCAFSGGYYYDASRDPPQTATQYIMTATANPNTPSDAAVPATSNTFAVTSFGAATQIAFTTQPTGVASATAATPFSGQPVVAVEDSFGNVVTSATNTIALAINSGAQGITLSNCNVPSATAAGLYVFSGCEGSNYGTNLTLTATSSGLTSATSAKFNITNVATQLLFTTQPVAGDSGSQLAIQPVLTIEDASNRVVTSATTPIAFNAVVPSSGTMTSCTNLVPQSGVVTVANCVFAGIVGTPYTVVSTSGSLTSAPSAAFTPSGPGPASQLVFVTSPVAGVSGTAFTTQPIIDVEDSATNLVTSSYAGITLTPSGGTLAGCTGLTASAGVVTVSNCTFAGVVGMPYTLTATSGSLTSSPSASFSPTYAGVPSQIVITGCSSAIVTPATCTASATIEDVYGNIETHDNSSVMTFSQVSGSGTVTGLASPTVAAGFASDTVAGAAQGLVGIEASADGLNSSALTVTVNAPTTTVVASSANPSVVGQTVTYTATVSVTSPDTGVPSGNIEFLDNGTAIGTCGGTSGVTVNGAGQASCLTSWPGVGTQSITAQYLGNAGAYYLASTSSTLSQVINQAATSTAVTSSANPSVVGQTVTLTATVTATSPGSGVPTGNIEFLDNGTAIGICGGTGGVTVNGSGQATCLTSWTGTGTQSITAQYLGSTNYLGSTSSTLSQVVNIAGTTTAVTSSVNPSVVGQTVTYTATVSVTAPGTGTPSSADSVTFKDGASTISCGTGSVAFNGTTATCTVTYASTTGSPHSITAVFGGDASYATSTSSALSQVVHQAATTTAVTSSSNPSVVGQTVTYTANVSVTAPGAGTPPATDTLTFKDGASTISCGTGSVAFNGTTATCTVTYATAAGSPHSITVVFGGDTNFVGSTSSPLSQVVNRAATTTVVASNLNPSLPNQTVTYTATVSVTAPGAGTPSAADTVTFKDGASTISCGTGSVAFNGTTATCNVTYANTTGSPHSITAVFGGDTNFFLGSTSSAITQTVNPSVTTTALVSGTNPSTAGQSVTFTATVSVSAPGTGTPTGNVEFLDNGTAIATCGGTGGVAVNGSAQATCSATFNVVGGQSITAQYLGVANYAASTSAVLTQTVNTASPSISIALSSGSINTGGSIHASSTLSGASGAAAGTVAYSYFTDSACTLNAVAVQTVTVTAGSVPNSNPNTTFNTGGIYYWHAVYSGDTNDNGATSPCVPLTVDNTVTKTAAGTYTLTIPAGVTTFNFTMTGAGGGGGVAGATGGAGGTDSGTITIPLSASPTTFTVIVGGGGGGGAAGTGGAGGASGTGCALGGVGGGGTDAGGGGGGSTCIYLSGAPAGTVIAIGGGGGGGGKGTGTGGAGGGGPTANPGTDTAGNGTASGGAAGTGGKTQTTGASPYTITNTAGKLGGTGALAGTCSAGTCGTGAGGEAGTTGGGSASVGGGGGGGGMASGGGGTDAGAGVNDKGAGGGGGSAYSGGTSTIAVAVTTGTNGGGGAGGGAGATGTAGSVSFTGAGLTLA